MDNKTYNIKRLKALEEYTESKTPSTYLNEWGFASQGSNKKYSCFMHDERHPSMFVNDEEGLFYCHSCGRGGGTAKLVSLFMQQKHSVSGYINGMEKYLKTTPEARTELGFVSIFDDGTSSTALSLTDIMADIYEMEHCKQSVEEIEIKLPPNIYNTPIEQILEHCIKIQNSLT